MTKSVDAASLSAAELFRHAAVHEAGHAVVGAHLGLTVLEIVIGQAVETAMKGYLQLGFTRFGHDSGDQCQIMREHPNVMGPALLAGSMAEDIVLGGHLGQGFSGDIEILRKGMGWTEANPMTPPRRQMFKTFTLDARTALQSTLSRIQPLGNTLIISGRIEGEALQALLL